MEGELLWKIISGLLASITLPTLWLLVSHLRGHAARDAEVDGRLAKAEGLIESNKAAADTAARGLQHQVNECKREDEKLEGLIVERQKAHDDCRDELSKSIAEMNATLTGIHTELKLRPCQQQGRAHNPNPGGSGNPGPPGSSCAATEEE